MITFGIGLVDERLRLLDAADKACDAAGATAGAHRQPVLADIIAEDVAGVFRHRAVEEDWHVGEPSLVLQLREMEQQALGPADRERRHHHRAAAPDRRLDDVADRVLRIDIRMTPVAVGGLHDQIVGAIEADRIDHGRIVVAAEIAGEHDRRAGGLDLQRGGAENVPGAMHAK